MLEPAPKCHKSVAGSCRGSFRLGNGCGHGQRRGNVVDVIHLVSFEVPAGAACLDVLGKAASLALSPAVSPDTAAASLPAGPEGAVPLCEPLLWPEANIHARVDDTIKQFDRPECL